MGKEFKIGSHTYRVDALGVFDQFDIARRVSPIITLLTIQKDREKLQKGFARAFVSMSAALSREDSYAILSSCLGQVSRKDKVGFSPIQVQGRMMFEDITMEQCVDLLWHVLLMSKIIDFFDVPASSSIEPGAGEASTS